MANRPSAAIVVTSQFERFSMKLVFWIVPLLAIAGLATAQDKGGGPVGDPGKGQPMIMRPGAMPRQGGGGMFGPGLMGIGVMQGRPGEPMALHPALMKLPTAKQDQLRKLHGDALKSMETILGDMRSKRE